MGDNFYELGSNYNTGGQNPEAAAEAEANRLFREKYGFGDPNVRPYVPEHGVEEIKLPGFGSTLGGPVVRGPALGPALSASERVDAISVGRAEMDAALKKSKELPADSGMHSSITGC